MSHALAGAAAAAGVMLAAAEASAPGRFVRLAPAEFAFPPSAPAQAGTSGVPGLQTRVVAGNPSRPGLYTILLRIPPHTRIQAHTHKDDRSAVVISGQWRIGYGDRFDAAKLKRLPPGGFYTEPPGAPHFAETGDEPVVVAITGYGPTDTRFVATSAPRP